MIIIIIIIITLLLWRWNNQHVTSVGQRKKSESPTGFEPMTSQTAGEHSIHWATENSWRGHILSSYLTCVLQTARISNVKIILYGFRFARISNVQFVLYGEEWKMVNFKLGEQMWRWTNQKVTSVGQRKKSESSTGFEPMTSQTPDVRSIH